MRNPTEEHGQDASPYWDEASSAFDDEPDHGLRDPTVLAAWTGLLRAWLPLPTSVLDAGCGTGSLSVLLASLGHRVTGADFSPRMLARARAKAAGLSDRPRFCVMDAGTPAFAARSFGAIICRHVLWALPERVRVLRRWAGLLRPGGRLLLFEGYWSTGGGLRAQKLVAELPPSVTLVAVEPLSDRSALWGKQVGDERYALIADVI